MIGFLAIQSLSRLLSASTAGSRLVTKSATFIAFTKIQNADDLLGAAVCELH